jgi:hypothetical protein
MPAGQRFCREFLYRVDRRHRRAGERDHHISAKQRTVAKIELISSRIETRERENTSSDKPGLTLLLSETIVIE